MAKIDDLKKKAEQLYKNVEPNHTKAVSAYFNMVSYCYNTGGGGLDNDIVPDVPELDTPEFWALFDQLRPDCTREQMRAWIDRPAAEDHRPKSESVLQLEEYLAERAANKEG